MVEGVQPDKRFVYYLMGATGIVVVPLTGFQCATTDFALRYWRPTTRGVPGFSSHYGPPLIGMWPAASNPTTEALRLLPD